MGSSTENSGFFTTRNPWNLDYVPGGSSGGSAAESRPDSHPFPSVKTRGICPHAASFCGVTDLRQLMGASPVTDCSRWFHRSTRSVRWRSAYDVALVLEAIAGHDPKDSTPRVRSAHPYSEILKKAESARTSDRYSKRIFCRRTRPRSG